MSEKKESPTKLSIMLAMLIAAEKSGKTPTQWVITPQFATQLWKESQDRDLLFEDHLPTGHLQYTTTGVIITGDTTIYALPVVIDQHAIVECVLDLESL